jgi:hypothetical protein
MALSVEVIDVSGVETAPLRDEVKALVRAPDYVEAIAAGSYTVVRYVDDTLDAVLGAAGRGLDGAAQGATRRHIGAGCSS